MYTGYLNTERNCSYQKAGIVNYILDLNSACMKAFPLAPSILNASKYIVIIQRFLITPVFAIGKSPFEIS